MRNVFTAFFIIAVLSVLALVVLYRLGAGPGRREILPEEPQPVAAKPTAAPAVAQPPAKPEAQPQGSAADPVVGVSLVQQHTQESVTQFDRALLFLAPASEAPQIEIPIGAMQPPVDAEGPPAAPAPEVAPAEKRWRGVVLVPKNMALATAHTALVRIPRLEAHPLDDGRVQIWVRVENPSTSPIRVGASCEFRFKGQLAATPRGYQEIGIPAGGSVDMDFLSPQPGAETYTVLVRPL